MNNSSSWLVLSKESGGKSEKAGNSPGKTK